MGINFRDLGNSKMNIVSQSNLSMNTSIYMGTPESTEDHFLVPKKRNFSTPLSLFPPIKAIKPKLNLNLNDNKKQHIVEFLKDSESGSSQNHSVSVGSIKGSKFTKKLTVIFDNEEEKKETP